jgi:hypothetical protein
MKVVAGSLGNDAIGPLAWVSGGVKVWPDEWGPRADGPNHFGNDFLVSHGGLRVVDVTSRNGSDRGAVALFQLNAIETRRFRSDGEMG